MYATGIIDIRLWDRARWKGTVFGYLQGDQAPPFMGLYFSNCDAGNDVFAQWRKYIGDDDTYEQIRVAIIEGDIEGQLPGYTIHVGANLEAAADLAAIRARRPLEGMMLTVGRVNRMTPAPNSTNLPTFKAKYEKWRKFLLLPVSGPPDKWQPRFDLAILKRAITWRNVTDIGSNDIDSIVLKKGPEEASQDSAVDEGAQASLTATISIFEAELTAGNVPQPLDPMVIDRLASVQRDMEGQVVPATVDPVLFSLATDVAANVLDRRARSVPLHDVQKRYFAMLAGIFDKPFREMTQYGVTPHDIASHMASDANMVKAVTADAEEWFHGMKEFWRDAGFVTLAHLQSMKTLKAVYGGNVFPHHDSDLTSNVALYADTIVLPDPLLGSLFMHEAIEPSQFAYVLIKNALHALRFKELAIAELTVPIVVFAPSYFFLEEKAAKLVRDLSEIDACRHCERIVGRGFGSLAEVQTFFNGFLDEASVAASIRDHTKFVFDVEESPLPLDQISAIQKDMQRYLRSDIDGLKGISGIPLNFIGRFIQSNACVAHCDLYGGVPLVDAPTSWQYLLWKYEYAATTAPPDNRDLFIQHALHDNLQSVPRLQNVPPSVLIQLRRDGSLEKLRAVFREGIASVRSADDRTVRSVADQVARNLRSALEEYQVAAAEMGKKKLGLALATTLFAGRAGLVVAAACTGNFPLALMAAIWGVAGFPSGKDIAVKGQELARAHSSLRRSPVGMLWRNNS